MAYSSTCHPQSLQLEKDSCAILGYMNKSGQPSHGNIQRTLAGLIQMGHRAGEIRGAGDGCGILTDIPRKLWAEQLQQAGQQGQTAYAPEFVVAHLFLPAAANLQLPQQITVACVKYDFEVLLEHSPQHTAEDEQHTPSFRQLALRFHGSQPVARACYELALHLEQHTQLHVASLSNQVAAYKVHGAPELLSRYYPELRRRDFLSSMTIGHSRFSTNTLPTVLRAQPFSLLGHNGEINTIDRVRQEARLLGVPLATDGSDSQDLNRTLEGLIHRYDLSLLEAMAALFPPIETRLAQMPYHQQQAYAFLRRFFPASAQGPAAIISRYGSECLFSVDAMGLRPLWFGHTDKDFFVSSELGIVPQEEILSDPKPLSPGEMVALQPNREGALQPVYQEDIQQQLWQRLQRHTQLDKAAEQLHKAAELSSQQFRDQALLQRSQRFHQGNLLSGFAWKNSDLQNLRSMARDGADPIASLGYDGPLAALARTPQNIADYCKEQVAVVTNPAIDREREAEHFSTSVYIGRSPQLQGRRYPQWQLAAPLLLGGLRRSDIPATAALESARQQGLATWEQLLGEFSSNSRRRYATLSLHLPRREDLASALERLAQEALQAVDRGHNLLVLDDSRCFGPGQDFLDPALVVARIQQTLSQKQDASGQARRRHTSLVLRSGAIRNLHDIMLLQSLGVDALCPYLIWELAWDTAGEQGLQRVLEVLLKGMQKVISTMGTHELCGYGPFFATIGLGQQVQQLLPLSHYCGGPQQGLSLQALEEQLRQRTQLVRSRTNHKVPRQFRLYPKIWQQVRAVARMEANYSDLSHTIETYEQEHPLALRHVLDFAFPEQLSQDPQQVDTRIGGHSLPILFSAMSFGSQGETPFRIYAEAAQRLNIICLNGEGGEIPDMLGRYRKNRGQQIASGRFGVNLDLLNSADFVEIKVGQGAKPGEGGHLPGFKVTTKIAAARNATPGVTLISPSNNHDIYSIEDLAQIIEELRTANPGARISVKVPAVAGIGTIAMGVAKAGADIITISGYDGGTGAARKHAIKFVGMPAELGVREAHRALACAGLRNKVEIWADGGARTGRDVVKMMLLGANRVGFGTLPMVVIGCTACRQCHLGACHVGIATQIETPEEAAAQGIKKFVPRVQEPGIIYLTTFFRALGQEIRTLTAKLGFPRTQDLVGRSDLLRQCQAADRLDLNDMLAIDACEWQAPPEKGIRIIRKPRNYLTQLIAKLVLDSLHEGEQRVRYEDDHAGSADRAIGTYLAGSLCREACQGQDSSQRQVELLLRRNAIPGNGLAAFNRPGIDIRVEGAAQDGVGKGATGGRIVILKGENREGQRVGGAVGKGLAYGAQGGLFLIQGDADSRACIRLSGADVVLGGRLQQPVDDSCGNLAGRANIKGFAFEYMTAGKVVVLGDPGPWICSGMTGGRIYCYQNPEMGMDKAALRRRLAWGAKVQIQPLQENDVDPLSDLLLQYHAELKASDQAAEAAWVQTQLARCRQAFVVITPAADGGAGPATGE